MLTLGMAVSVCSPQASGAGSAGFGEKVRRDPHRRRVNRSIVCGPVDERLDEPLEILLQPTELVRRELGASVEEARRPRPGHVEPWLDPPHPLRRSDAYLASIVLLSCRAARWASGASGISK